MAETVSGLVFLKNVGFGLLALGGLFVIVGLYFVWQAHFADWIETRAEVTSVTVQTGVRHVSDRTRRHVAYYPRVAYTYHVEGQRYESSRYRQTAERPDSADRDEALARALKFRNGDPLTVYYCADNPEIAVVDPEVGWDSYVALLLGLLTGGLGLALLRLGSG